MRALTNFCLFALGFLTVSSTLANDTIQVDTGDLVVHVDSIGKPVIVAEDTVFLIHYSYGVLSVNQLADQMSQSLSQAAESFDPQSDSLRIQFGEKSARIFLGDQMIAYIPQVEADVTGKDLPVLASEWKSGIESAYVGNISTFDQLVQYGVALAIVLIVLILLNWLLKKLFGGIKNYFKNRKSRLLKGIRIRDFELFDSNDELELIYKLIWLVRIAFWLIIAFIIFPFIFSFFPATKVVTYTILGYIYDPLVSIGRSIINFLPDLFTILVIIFIVRFVLKYLKIFFRRIEFGRIKIDGFYKDWAPTTYMLLKIFIIALSFVMIFPYLPGAQSDVFKGVSVFIGIVFSIGSTSIVGNLVAGLVITYMRPFNIGDRIRIAEVEGEIVKKTPFVIRIKTPKNEYITLPNSNVLNGHIINYNSSFDEGGIILHTTVTIGYDIPWRQVNSLLLRAADQIEYLEKKPEPFVLQKSLGDFSVAYQLNAYTKRPLDKDRIQSMLHQHIQDIFSEAGVEILSPNYMATRDGNESTVPDYSQMQPRPEEDIIPDANQEIEEEHDEPDGSTSKSKKEDDSNAKSGNQGIDDPEYD
jgi:small-conductance mechanosensitive channel